MRITKDGEKPVVRIAVRQLVEFLMCSGSLDNRSSAVSAERMQHGSRIHRRIQKSSGDNYQSEVFLSHTTHFEQFDFIVEGRADGLIQNPDGTVYIDEIKSTEHPLADITEDYNPLHWAQAMCYAYFYASDNLCSQIHVQLTYCNISDETTAPIRFVRQFSVMELKQYYDGLVFRYEKWAVFSLDWEKQCIESVKEISFPFDNYHPGQYTLAGTVFKTIRDGGTCFCQAPTGIGKTISTLFPAIKALGEGHVCKIFYLTAKTTARKSAEEALTLLRGADGKSIRLKSVTLTAKDRICFMNPVFCNPENCTYAAGHYDRVNDAVWDGLQSYDFFDRGAIELLARKHSVCPFELGLDLTLWSECVIGDYNHLFDPSASLKRFFAFRGEYAFLIDEAHNLVDRARDMYTARLRKTAFSDVKNSLPKTDKAIRKALNAINREFIRKRNKDCTESGYWESECQDEAFLKAILAFIPICEKWMEISSASAVFDGMRGLYFDSLFYIKISEMYNSRYVTAAEVFGRDVVVGQYCIDPSELLRSNMNKGKASVLFSATLTPLDYYADVLGGDENSIKLSLPSPFDRNNFGLFIANRINTRYRNREQTVGLIVEMISCVISAKDGNYMIYFPSYLYMQSVYEEFCKQYPDTDTIVQQPGMEEEQRSEFLERFENRNKHTLVGFCVMGGVFSEGINLKGNRLIGTVIVGVGLPRIGNHQDRIRRHFDRTERDGYAFAYRYPGMNKVMQAAGRVVRGETDRGIALLIDDRFNTDEYLKLFPDHWRHCLLVGDTKLLGTELHRFWTGLL